jgi:hypothetical protein
MQKIKEHFINFGPVSKEELANILFNITTSTSEHI